MRLARRVDDQKPTRCLAHILEGMNSPIGHLHETAAHGRNGVVIDRELECAIEHIERFVIGGVPVRRGSGSRSGQSLYEAVGSTGVGAAGEKPQQIAEKVVGVGLGSGHGESFRVQNGTSLAQFMRRQYHNATHVSRKLSPLRLDTGRTNQKSRTRQALLAAARRVMGRGEPVTVLAAAHEAGISKATAYRYFSASETLVLEAVLDGKVVSPEEIVGDAKDVRERVLRVQRYLFALTRESETTFRLFLARALDASVAGGGQASREIRGGRRLPMYEHALAPVRSQMSRKAFEFLVLSLSAASGMESYLALKDVCRVDDSMADRIAASNIEAILDKLLPQA